MIQEQEIKTEDLWKTLIAPLRRDLEMSALRKWKENSILYRMNVLYQMNAKAAPEKYQKPSLKSPSTTFLTGHLLAKLALVSFIYLTVVSRDMKTTALYLVPIKSYS